MRIRTLILAAVACAALTVPAIASAHPAPRTLARTFPLASRLCHAVANGHTPKRLQASVDQLSQACEDLQGAFTQAQSDFQTATSGLQQQLTDARNQAVQACQAARQTGDRQACRQAIADARATVKGLKGQLKAALAQYHTAVSTARRTFWSTVHSLRGGAGIKADSPTQE